MRIGHLMKPKSVIITIILLAVGMVFAGLQSSQKLPNTQKTTAQTLTTNTVTDTGNNQTVTKNKKILIAYFSHTGNTKSFAENIQKEIGGDLFAIEPLAAYPKDYDKNLCGLYGDYGMLH